MKRLVRCAVVLEGLKRVAPQMQISYAKGANLVDDFLLLKQFNNNGAEITPDKKSPAQLIEDAVAVAKKADIAVLVLGESAIMGGEATSRTNLDLLPKPGDFKVFIGTNSRDVKESKFTLVK